MSIAKYTDKDGLEYYKVRVAKASPINSKIRVDKYVLKIKTYAEAEKVERQLVRDVERELFTKESKGESWENMTLEWYEAAYRGDIFTKNLAKRSIEDYYSNLRKYTAEWARIPIQDIDKSKVWLKLDYMDREYSFETRKKLRTAIDAVFKWAILSGKIQSRGLPTEGYQSMKKTEEKLPEILSLDEIRLLLKVAKEQKHPWYEVWVMALYTGMRSGELYALRWKSIDFENQMIYVHENWTNITGYGPTKGRYWRAVPISDHMFNFLKELKLKTGSTEFVLPRFGAWEQGAQATVLREFCEGHGLVSVKFHTLRSCFATQLIKDGIAPAVVMKMAGWRDLKTMQRYIRLAGIEVKGATNGLKILPDEEVMGRVVNLFEL